MEDLDKARASLDNDYVKKLKEKNRTGEEEFRKHFMGDFDLKPQRPTLEIDPGDGIDRTLKVEARF